MKKVALKKRYDQKIEQKRLKEQYGVENQDVIVIEKKNVISQTLRVVMNAAFAALRIAAFALIALLALVGLAGLIYPNIRAEYAITYQRMFTELSGYF